MPRTPCTSAATSTVTKAKNSRIPTRATVRPLRNMQVRKKKFAIRRLPPREMPAITLTLLLCSGNCKQKTNASAGSNWDRAGLPCRAGSRPGSRVAPPARYAGAVMATRAVVFGSLGQLGVELVRELHRRGWEVFGYDKPDLDITDGKLVQERLASLAPEVVFNAAAYNQVDVAEEEPEAAFAVNALAVRNIALGCRQTGALLVHYSTDYVFDGCAGRPYTENDPPHPLGAYGISKLAGEYCAQAYPDRWIVIRTSGVYGPGGLHTARGNFIEVMLRLALEGKPIRVVADHVASPTYAPALAGRSVDLVERKLDGLFHIGGGRAISWFDWAQMIFQAAGLEPELRPSSEREHRTAARRPKYSALSNAKIERLGLAPMPPLQEALRSYLILRQAELGKA